MKENIIYLLVYLFTELFNYTLAYVVIFQASLGRGKKRWGILICMMLLVHFLILHFAGLEAASAVSFFTMIIIPAFLLDLREKKYFLLYPFVVIGTSVVGMSMSFLLATMLKIPEHIIAEGNWYTIICQCVQSFALILMAGYRKLKNKNSYQVNLEWKQYLMFYIVAICLFLMLAPLQVLTEEYGSGKYINLIGFSVSIVCIVLVNITIWYGIVVNREIQLKECNKQNEEYIKLQKEYYTKLIEQDEKLRRFRHDMKSHMMVIKSRCQNDDCKGIESYLNCIVEESAIFSIERYTGNKGVDAVIMQLFTDAKNHQIDIEVEGSLPVKTRVTEYDLCTILFNLIKNAIEACERMEEISKRKIRIAIGNYNDLIYIYVKNTFDGKIVIKNDHLITTKKDMKNHGIGSENVKNTVKKYDGILECQCDKGWFSVEVSI